LKSVGFRSVLVRSVWAKKNPEPFPAGASFYFNLFLSLLMSKSVKIPATIIAIPISNIISFWNSGEASPGSMNPPRFANAAAVDNLINRIIF